MEKEYEMQPEAVFFALHHFENLLLRGFYNVDEGGWTDSEVREVMTKALDELLAYALESGFVTISEGDKAVIARLHTRPEWKLYKLCTADNPYIVHHSRCRKDEANRPAADENK